MKTFTQNIFVEIEELDWKEFEIQVVVSIENDSIGYFEAWGHKFYDKKEDYLGSIQEFTVIGRASLEELKNIEQYVLNNEENILDKMRDWAY